MTRQHRILASLLAGVPLAPTPVPAKPPASQPSGIARKAPSSPAGPLDHASRRPGCGKAPAGTTARMARSPYAAHIDRQARAHGVDSHVLHSLLWHESRMDPRARNPRTGALGLGQFVPSGRAAVSRIRRAKGQPWRFTANDALNPFFAISAAAELVAHLVDHCGSTLRGLGAYASGSCKRGLRQARRVIRYAEWLRAEEPRT